jgi:hypothetical protein
MGFAKYELHSKVAVKSYENIGFLLAYPRLTNLLAEILAIPLCKNLIAGFGKLR